MLAVVIAMLMTAPAFAHDTEVSSDLRYFVVQGTAAPQILKQITENPLDPWAGAESMVAGIPGAKLIDYYFEVGTTRNLAIVALPSSLDAAAITYQRMATGFMEDMVVFEVLPSSQVKEMLERVQKLNEFDYLK